MGRLLCPVALGSWRVAGDYVDRDNSFVRTPTLRRMAMSLLGPSLEAVKKELEPTRFFALAHGALECVRALHDHGLIHRDIKPAVTIRPAAGHPAAAAWRRRRHPPSRRTLARG